MSCINSKNAVKLQNSHGYFRYIVRTFFNKKEKVIYFPYTEKGLKEAEAYSEVYKKKKLAERNEKLKNRLHGIRETKKYRDGGLKNIGIYFVANSNIKNPCRIDIQAKDGKATMKCRTINHRGFNKVFDMQIEFYCTYNGLNMNDDEVKTRIEKTRVSFFNQYVEFCKEHGLSPNL